MAITTAIKVDLEKVVVIPTTTAAKFEAEDLAPLSDIGECLHINYVPSPLHVLAVLIFYKADLVTTTLNPFLKVTLPL